MGCGLNNSNFVMFLYGEGCQIWNRIYDLFLFQGRNCLFDFQSAKDEPLPVHIYTQPKKREHAWAKQEQN